MKLKLGFSPCPNDTFIFDAMVHGKVDTEGLEFGYFLADVEELNGKAFKGVADILKVSYHAYAWFASSWVILDSGSALGYKNGPLLVSRTPYGFDDVPGLRVAIPGQYTTANMLFSIAWPKAVNKVVYLFSEIEQAVLDGAVDAGLIIHESRFTYHSRGLTKIADMGEYWEGLTGLPMPLGAIVANRNLPEETILKVNRIIRRSLEYAFRNPSDSEGFVAEHAREMDRDVVASHIKLYFTGFSLDLGSAGKEAVKEFFRRGFKSGVIPPLPERIFIS